jgi:type I restriction enzyme M protein
MPVRHLSERRTEDLAQDLLRFQRWDTRKPPRGRVVKQNEYKGFPNLRGLFTGASKTGAGDALPDFLCTDVGGDRPLLVIETKADSSELLEAVDEASYVYGEACRAVGHPVVAVGIAGQEEEEHQVAVRHYQGGEWVDVLYEGEPITWLPTPDDVELLLQSSDRIDIAPVVPDPVVLAAEADLINRLLREAGVKDEYRPAYIGAFMLAMWHSRGLLDRAAPTLILRQINHHCEAAMTRAGKGELAKSLRVDQANMKLAKTAWRIIAELDKLNVVSPSYDHDYLGHLYETFFRYTGGNTIGQYFTPRHITRFMADLAQVSPSDAVVDPACGTGGFLVAAIQRARDVGLLSYEDTVRLVEEKLHGFEAEPVTAALCVVNMILRGDGKTGVVRGDVLTTQHYKAGSYDVALMNPPFPHKKTDVPSQVFVERALEGLRRRGVLAVLLPTSLLVKRDVGIWRQKILTRHTLRAVVELPDELFQPFAAVTTSVVLLEAGLPHPPSAEVAFVRVSRDGFELRKGVRVQRSSFDDQLPQALDAVLNRRVVPGFSGTGRVLGAAEWSPGAYVPAAIPEDSELREGCDVLLRRLVSFYARYAREIRGQRAAVEAGELVPAYYRSLLSSARLQNALRPPGGGESTLGSHFDIVYGQKELHSREGIPPGRTLVVSPTESYNGCYGWLEFPSLLAPSFVTVAQTGSIGEAFVQLEPCAVNDDCLVLLPKAEASVGLLLLAASTIRLNKWRFSYGRKLTPSRIAHFPFNPPPHLVAWADGQWENWSKICEAAVAQYPAEAEDEVELPPVVQ